MHLRVAHEPDASGCYSFGVTSESPLVSLSGHLDLSAQVGVADVTVTAHLASAATTTAEFRGLVAYTVTGGQPQRIHQMLARTDARGAISSSARRLTYQALDAVIGEFVTDDKIAAAKVTAAHREVEAAQRDLRAAQVRHRAALNALADALRLTTA